MKKIFINICILGITLVILKAYFYTWHGHMFSVMSLVFGIVSSIFTVLLGILVSGLFDEYYKKKYGKSNWKKVR